MMHYYKLFAFLNAFGLISSLISVIGIILFFINPVFTIFCAAFSIINSILQVFFGEQNSFSTETIIIIIIIAVIIASLAKISYINTISFALCIGEVLLCIIGWIFMLLQK